MSGRLDLFTLFYERTRKFDLRRTVSSLTVTPRCHLVVLLYFFYSDAYFLKLFSWALKEQCDKNEHDGKRIKNDSDIIKKEIMQ